MKIAPTYLVIGERKGRPAVRRATQTWPTLEPGEAFVRVSLVLPDDFLESPVHTVEIEADAITVAVEVVPQEDTTT